MPNQNRKIMEKELNKRIKAINKLTGSRVSYKTLYAQAQNIFAMEEGEREAALTEAYIALSKSISENVLFMRSLIKSNALLEDKYRNHEANNHSVVDSSIYAKELIASMMELIDPENANKYAVTPKQLSAIRDYEMDEIRSHNSHKEMPKILERWDRKCFEEDIKRLEELLPNEKISNKKRYNYTGDKNNPKDIIAAEYFYKARLVKEELAKHNRIWRFFNFRKVATYERYIEAVDDQLAFVRFNVDWEDDRPLELLKDNVMAPHVEDAKQINIMYDLGMLNYKGSDPESSKVNDTKLEEKEKPNIAADNEKSADEILRIKAELEAQLQADMDKAFENSDVKKAETVSKKELPNNKILK